MRLIDADELRKTMYHEAFETDTDMQRWDSGCWIRYKMFENALENAPNIEAEPVKHGHWIRGEKIYPDMLNDTTYGYWCSECHHADVHGDNTHVSYCWNCGAKMDLGEVEE